jgi:prophage antirepressor-like protein
MLDSAGPEPKAMLQALLDQHGPLMGGADLVRALGFSNNAAFREAHRKGRLGVHIFSIPERRGRFALTHDIAAWIEQVSQQNKKGDLK